jgi:hypothetical protein
MLASVENQLEITLRHLKENNVGYFRHLFRAWRWAFILIVHGLFPNVWETKVGDEIIQERNKKYWRPELGV